MNSTSSIEFRSAAEIDSFTDQERQAIALLKAGRSFKEAETFTRVPLDRLWAIWKAVDSKNV